MLGSVFQIGSASVRITELPPFFIVTIRNKYGFNVTWSMNATPSDEVLENLVDLHRRIHAGLAAIN
jgi:hypothetical protein